MMKTGTKKFTSAEKKQKEIEKANPNVCLMCGEKKNNPKLIFTHFCSLKCFTKYHFPEGFKRDYSWQIQ